MLIRSILLFLMLTVISCLPKIYFNQTFSSAEKVPVTKDGYIALPDGENFDGSIILEEEKRSPEDISVVKVHGTYLVVADGFRHLWAIFPVSGDKAKVKRIDLIKEDEKFSDPGFEISSQTRCVIFKFNTENGSRSVFVDRDGDIDEKRCDDD